MQASDKVTGFWAGSLIDKYDAEILRIALEGGKARIKWDADEGCMTISVVRTYVVMERGEDRRGLELVK